MPQTSKNPFSPDRPIVDEENYFGNEDAVEWVSDQFLDGQRFVVFFGTHRIGKTSLLFHLRRKLAGKAFPVYLDLAAYPQVPARELLWNLLLEVHEELAHEREGIEPLSQEAYLSQWDYVHEAVLPTWRRTLEGRRLLLLLDGFELARLRDGAWVELVLRLREVVSADSDLLIVAAVRGASTQTREPVPALRGLPARDLEPLREDETEELLVGMARYQLRFDYDALRRIHAWTGGHPYLVQLFGAELYRRLATYGQVAIHVVADVAPVVAAAAGEFFAEQWDALSREAQIVLAAIGSLHGNRGTVTSWDIVLALRRAGTSRTAEAVEQTLQELRDRRIIRWFGGAAYALGEELRQLWLSEIHPLPEVLLGKRPARPRDAALPRRRLGVDWGAILLWVAIGLAIVLVGRVWTSRRSRTQAVIPMPTVTVQSTPRPTATRVPLPGLIAYMAQPSANVPWSIWTMHDDGTDPLRLTDGSSEDMMPAWSPDGKRLAFISNRGGNRDVWAMNADGTHLENLTRTPADEWTPAWSPDGTEIAFASYRDGNWELYIARSDGSQPKRITWHPSADYAPAWSPDGSRLAFVSQRDGNPEIYVVSRDGTGLARLTKNEATDLAPCWSPDGRSIAFESYRDGNMEIYTMSPDGTNVRNVSNEPKTDEHGPCWSPDGRWLAYYSNRDGSWDIFLMSADGTRKTNLTMSPAIEMGPAWQPQAP